MEILGKRRRKIAPAVPERVGAAEGASAMPQRAIAPSSAVSGGIFWWAVAAIALFTFLLPLRASALTLSQKQTRFSALVARLIVHAEDMGYTVTLGEAWRSAEVAKFQTRLNEAKGIGIANSLHRIRLAIDINLFHDGKYLTSTADYRSLGEWWENQSAGEIRCRWGGRFKRADGNHFSVEHEGVQ